MLKKFKKDINFDKIDFDFIYPTTPDAVHYILRKMPPKSASFIVNSFYENDLYKILNSTTHSRAIKIDFTTRAGAFTIEQEDIDDYYSDKTTTSISV